MIRQAHHERNQLLTVRPEPVEGLNQSFLKVVVIRRIAGLAFEEAELDLFDQTQLQAVLDVCQDCNSLSQARYTLLAVSLVQRGSTNVTDHLRIAGEIRF